MLIKTGEAESKSVTNYEFTFSNGFFMQVPIDESVGDRITFYNDRIVIALVAKPDPLNPKETLGEENTTLLKQHLLMWTVRIIQRTSPSMEERISYEDFIKSAVKTTVN